MPTVVIFGGPNGAGKTTLAQTLLPGFLHITEYVNADQIAGGLSSFNPISVAFDAGRTMLRRIHDLAASGVDFAFESTLAS
jgi:predicted ABC-type ATPase